MKSDQVDFDTVLEYLKPWGPDLKNGLSNHAPMACEALYTLGRPEAIFPWLEKYGKEFQKKKSPVGRIESEHWKQSLGRSNLFPEWEKFFEVRISETSWQEVLSVWVANLSPGICADATHGVIRTAHAVRSLGRKETPLRIGELVSGLALWASMYLELPSSFVANSNLHPSEAILHVPFVPEERKKFSGTIVSSLEGLRDFSEFSSVISLISFQDGLENCLSDMIETFARVFLNNTFDALSTIVFVHSITSISAIRNLLPFMEKKDCARTLQYSWQTSAGLYSAFGKNRNLEIAKTIFPESRERSIEKAILHGDEHAIKFTEVCLKEYELNPSPVYLAAAERALKFLQPLD